MIQHNRHHHITSSWLGALALLLALFALFIFGLDWLNVRPDELLSYDHTSRSLRHTVWYQARQDVQAPLWHSFLWTWRQFVGATEFTGRYQGVLWSMLTASLVYTLAQHWFANPRYGWAGLVVLGVNAYFFRYAFEIRPYPLVMLVATLAMWLFWRWLRRSTWRRALGYGLSLTLLAYVHYFLAWLVLIQLIYFVSQRRTHRQWVQLAGAFALALVVWMPWLPSFLYQVNNLYQVEGVGSLGIASTTQSTSPEVVWRWVRLATGGMPYLWIALSLLGTFFVWRREYGLLLLWGWGVPVVAFTVNLVANVYDERYIVYTSVGLSLAAAAALASLPRRWLRWAAIAAFVVLNLWQLPSHLPDRVPYRHIIQRMNANSQTGDTLYFDGGIEQSAFVAWHLNQYMADTLLENQIVSVDEGQAVRRVWYVSGDVTQPQTKARFNQLERTHPQKLVTGHCKEGYCFIARLLEGAPSPQQPTAVFTSDMSGDTLHFHGVDVESVRRDRVVLRLWWMPTEPLLLDYSVSVRLVDEAGTIVAQTDNAPLTQNGERLRTSQLEPGRMVIDWRVLALPSDLNPGAYTVQIVVYQPIDGYNLRLLDRGEAVLPLETIIIP
jgi:hypothetical protein